MPGLGPDPDYSRWVYPDPPSHDFCAGIVTAELMRRVMGAPAPLTVRLLPHQGQLGLFDFGHKSVASVASEWPDKWPRVSMAYSDRMIQHVIMPAIEMMGAKRLPDLDVTCARRLTECVEYDHHIKGLVDAARAGYEIPRWQVPGWAFDEVDLLLGGERPVVITLRECAVQPERNSQLAEWLKFAKSIERKYRVLFVRDTAKAEVPLVGFSRWVPASENAYVRAALYQRALVNLMVSNGPGVWAIFSDAPYLIFKQLIPALPEWEHGQPKGWREQDHMEVGDQYPWAGPNQRLAWADDTFENITRAFREFVG